MIVALTGTHSTGKTTLLELFQKQNNNLKFYTGIAREFRDFISINESGDDITQACVISDHIRRSQILNSIHDRCIIDAYAYTYYFYLRNKVSLNILNYSIYSLNRYINNYDIVCYIPIEFNAVDDGVRSINNEFRNEIDCIIQSTLDIVDPKKLITLTGTIEERCNKLIKLVI